MFFHKNNKSCKNNKGSIKMYCFDGDCQWIRDQLRILGVRFESGHIMGECYVRTRLTPLQYQQIISESKRLGKLIGRWKVLEENQNFEFGEP